MNTNGIQLDRIIRRASQGVTRPFLCSSTEGDLYWLKGRNTGMGGLCHEWVAGRMAMAFGLPVPDFQIIEVRDRLIASSSLPDARELGVGLAFASRHVQSDGDLTCSTSETLPPDLKLRILVFDAWIRNEDRTLGKQGGNVNLLWNQISEELWVIDHNNAFDPEFNRERFLENHVFRDVLSSPELHSANLLAFFQRMNEIRNRLIEFFHELPSEWLEIAETQKIFSLESIRKMVCDQDQVSHTLKINT